MSNSPKPTNETDLSLEMFRTISLHNGNSLNATFLLVPHNTIASSVTIPNESTPPPRKHGLVELCKTFSRKSDLAKFCKSATKSITKRVKASFTSSVKKITRDFSARKGKLGIRIIVREPPSDPGVILAPEPRRPRGVEFQRHCRRLETWEKYLRPGPAP